MNEISGTSRLPALKLLGRQFTVENNKLKRKREKREKLTSFLTDN